MLNEELVKAGIMESGDGLRPSSEGYRIRFSDAQRSISKGPFLQTSELLAGYWVWNVQSMEDFAAVDTSGEFRDQEEALRHTLALQKSTANPYLFFSGRCEEALDFYQQHLGAKLGMLMRFNQSPDPVPGECWQRALPTRSCMRN